MAERSADAVAGEAGLGLLVGGEGVAEGVLEEDGGLAVEGGGLGAVVGGERTIAGRGAGDLAGVVAPVEADVRAALAELVLHVGSLVELLVVVDAEGRVGYGRAGRRGDGAASSGLRSEEARGNRREDNLGGEVVAGRNVQAAIEAGDLGVVPAD